MVMSSSRKEVHSPVGLSPGEGNAGNLRKAYEGSDQVIVVPSSSSLFSWRKIVI